MSIHPPTKRLILSVVSYLLIIDYFFFVTGNPSVTYGLLGGWFLITVAGFLVSMAFVCSGLISDRANPPRKHIWLAAYLVGLVMLSGCLYLGSARARSFAESRIKATVSQLITDPKRQDFIISDDDRKRLLEVESGGFTHEYEGFIPTFRRMDYLFNGENGARYRLIATLSWDGTPQVTFREVKS